jgi:RNA polymerase sigma-70 factor (ECF subfamily)
MLVGVQAHDHDAWDRLVEVWGPVIYGWCRRSGLQPSDTEDVSQEVFLQVAMKIDQFERKTFRGWLWTITSNKIADHFRESLKRPKSPGGSSAVRWMASLAESGSTSQEEPSATESSRLIVRRVLKVIRRDFKETTFQAFERTAIQKQSSAEVAKDLGVSKDSVRRMKYRVLKRLREELEGMI